MVYVLVTDHSHRSDFPVQQITKFGAYGDLWSDRSPDKQSSYNQTHQCRAAEQFITAVNPYNVDEPVPFIPAGSSPVRHCRVPSSAGALRQYSSSSPSDHEKASDLKVGGHMRMVGWQKHKPTM